jgi:hypothetical protein
MKTVLRVLPVLLTILSTLASVSADSSQDVLTVAIFDFESSDEAVRALGPQVATLLNASLSNDPRFILVERADLEKIMGEQELSLSGTIAPDTAAKVGQWTGAKVLITGRVFKFDRELLIVAKIIGTETSRVYGELVKAGSGASIRELTTELAGKIGATLETKGHNLVARVLTRDQRLDQVRQTLKDAARPVVSVSIAERHFGGPTLDPAAETELSSILAACGFPLADQKSDLKPRIEITGEAFSELGLRRGNLVSCKARIEVKARDRATGNLLLVDRQTSVAVDLSEQIAAKSALELAALELAQRLLPILVR